MSEDELNAIWNDLKVGKEPLGWGGTEGSGEAPGDLDTLIFENRLWARHNNRNTVYEPGPWTEIPGMAGRT